MLTLLDLAAQRAALRAPCRGHGATGAGMEGGTYAGAD